MRREILKGLFFWVGVLQSGGWNWMDWSFDEIEGKFILFFIFFLFWYNFKLKC